MASGPEHYGRADSIMQKLAKAADSGTFMVPVQAQLFMAQAQVHATLALAAATAMACGTDAPRMHMYDFEAWDAVAGVPENDDDALWQRHDVSDVMQTVEIHDAPAPGDEPPNQDGPF